MEQPPPLPPHQSPPHGGQPLAYQPAWTPPAPSSNGRRFLWLFLAGALGGAAVSAVGWIAGFDTLMKYNGPGPLIVLVAVPGLKLAVGIPLLCFRRWRGLGAGIMVSIALGFLIFFGNCVTHLSQLH